METSDVQGEIRWAWCDQVGMVTSGGHGEIRWAW